MDTHRSYYTDAYTTSFTAKIQDKVTDDNGRYALILDHTFFYPSSGGQPHDTGTINDVPVVDVTVRDDDDAVLHWVEQDVPDQTATAVINKDRRFDHMQQHTGQHILSQAFIQIAEAETVSFHLSNESVTIDLAIGSLSAVQIERVEQLANQIVWQNRPINVQFVTLTEAQMLPLRKIPPTKNGQLRLVDIENFDLTACGGTHVNRTGSVGIIKIIKMERRADQLRVEFRCGNRALNDYGHKHEVLTQLSTELTTSYTEIPASVEKLRAENKRNGRSLKKLKSDLLGYEAERLLNNGRSLGEFTLVTHVFSDKEGDELRLLGNHLSQQPNVIALLGMTGNKTQLVFCRGENAPGNMNQLLRAAFQVIKGGGGGSSQMAQGGGPAADVTAVANAIEQAAQLLT